MTVWERLQMDVMRDTITKQRQEIAALKAELQATSEALAVVNATLDEVRHD